MKHISLIPDLPMAATGSKLDLEIIHSLSRTPSSTWLNSCTTRGYDGNGEKIFAGIVVNRSTTGMALSGLS